MATIEMADLKPGDCLIIEVQMFGNKETYGLAVYDRVEPVTGEIVDWPVLKTLMNLSFDDMPSSWAEIPATGTVYEGGPLPWYREARALAVSKNGMEIFRRRAESFKR